MLPGLAGGPFHLAAVHALWLRLPKVLSAFTRKIPATSRMEHPDGSINGVYLIRILDLSGRSWIKGIEAPKLFRFASKDEAVAHKNELLQHLRSHGHEICSF